MSGLKAGAARVYEHMATEGFGASRRSPRCVGTARVGRLPPEANAGSWDEAVVQEDDSERPVPDEADVRAATNCIRGRSNSAR